MAEAGEEAEESPTPDCARLALLGWSAFQPVVQSHFLRVQPRPKPTLNEEEQL